MGWYHIKINAIHNGYESIIDCRDWPFYRDCHTICAPLMRALMAEIAGAFSSVLLMASNTFLLAIKMQSCRLLCCFILKITVFLKAQTNEYGDEAKFPESLQGLDNLCKIVVDCQEIPRQFSDLTSLKDIELHYVDNSAANEQVTIAFAIIPSVISSHTIEFDIAKCF